LEETIMQVKRRIQVLVEVDVEADSEAGLDDVVKQIDCYVDTNSEYGTAEMASVQVISGKNTSKKSN
jgi:hypothetical protein